VKGGLAVQRAANDERRHYWKEPHD